MKRITTLAIATLLACAGNAAAQSTEADTLDNTGKTAEQITEKIIVKGPDSIKPSIAHENYGPIIGEWDMNWKLLDKEGEITRQLKGNAKNEWIVGGRWVQSAFATDMEVDGEQFHGFGLFGHDNTTGEYHNVWFESNRTAVQYDTGSYDAQTKTFTFQGDQPGRDGTRFTTRTTMRIDSSDKHTIELFVIQEQDVAVRILELVMTRTPDEDESTGLEADDLMKPKPSGDGAS